jgi:hypothetical protein
MTFSLAEMFLGAWAIVMTVLWVKAKEDMKLLRWMTTHHLRRLHKKEVVLVDTGTHFEFKEIKQ